MAHSLPLIPIAAQSPLYRSALYTFLAIYQNQKKF